MLNNKWILFVSPQIYPCKMGGIEVFNYYLSRELKNVYPIHLLTYCNSKSFKGIEIHKIAKKRYQKLFSPIEIFLFLIRNRKNIKVVYFAHARSYWTYWITYILAKKIFGIKYGFTSHGGSLFKGKPKFPYKYLFKNAEFITGVSERIIKENTKRSNRKIIFSPPLIPFDVIHEKNRYREKWNIKKDELVLLYVGSLKSLKSVDTLIEALGIFSKAKLNKWKLRVLIAGDGVSRIELENRVKELNLDSIVTFFGIVDRDNINQLYNLADIYTICSEFEGLPISLLEAFANNLPCITSDAPGLIEISFNNKNTLLFKVKDYIDYANKIEMLIIEDQLRNRIRNNARIYYEKHYSYDILVNQFKVIFNKI